jgi:PTH1 family peptidyl-tRNA hydrolase
MLIDRLFERAGGRKFRDEAGARVAQISLAGHPALLVKPQTFMNLSGDAVRPLLDRYCEGSPANLIVFSDDVALPFGMIRIRPRGSAGGQKGLKSIIERLGTQDFARLRLGAAPDHPISDLARFVLSRIPKRDVETLRAMLDRGMQAVDVMVSEGVERAMSLFNERVQAVTSEATEA